jgi:hypothetical protein
MLRQNRLFVRNVQSFSGSNQRSTFHRSHEAASAPTESDVWSGRASQEIFLDPLMRAVTEGSEPSIT